ncbi:MAG: hypothetical protein IPP72_03790 [Chitinophagaceae bacterium]|nr:hypothetical protein [Chitinophagaceae bacterium]
MTTAHSEEIKPYSMAGGGNRLIIVVALGIFASFIFYVAAKPLGKKHAGGHGEGHKTETAPAAKHE